MITTSISPPRSSSKLGELIVLGMLSQLKHGKYFLEDPTGFVELDLSKTVYHSGIFTGT